MNAQTKIEPVTMRTPFPAHQISKLPKETRAQIDERNSDRTKKVFNCSVCGGHHHKNAVHLDYVGHAALTDRLLDVDTAWNWEPVSFNDDGLPAFDRNGGLWIRLTVNGVTRLGYGNADGKSGGDAIKEIIGDALRNAAMRFGAALDLWHKGDLHLDADEGSAGGQSEERTVSPRPTISDDQLAELELLIPAASLTPAKFNQTFGIKATKDLPAARFNEARDRLQTRMAELAKSATNQQAKEPA